MYNRDMYKSRWISGNQDFVWRRIFQEASEPYLHNGVMPTIYKMKCEEASNRYAKGSDLLGPAVVTPDGTTGRGVGGDLAVVEEDLEGD